MKLLCSTALRSSQSQLTKSYRSSLVLSGCGSVKALRPGRGDNERDGDSQRNFHEAMRGDDPRRSLPGHQHDDDFRDAGETVGRAVQSKPPANQSGNEDRGGEYEDARPEI